MSEQTWNTLTANYTTTGKLKWFEENRALDATLITQGWQRLGRGMVTYYRSPFDGQCYTPVKACMWLPKS